MPHKTIDLRKYHQVGVGVLAGRERGEFVRSREELDRLDDDARFTATVVIPDWVFSVNSSFFLGMFSESIRKLGAEEFRKRYFFEGPNAERVRDEGVRRAVLAALPLPVARIA